MSVRSCRVHICTYEDGRVTGQLLPRSSALLDRPPPSAYSSDEDELLADLEIELSTWLARGGGEGREALEPFLWEETLEPHLLRLDVPLLTATNRQHVLGKRKVPLRVTYFHAELQAGGFRLLAPRFGVELIVEELSLAADMLRLSMTELLLGEEPEQIYDLRPLREESVRAWIPSELRRRRGRPASEQPSYPVLGRVAEELVARARAGRLTAVLGAQAEVEQLVTSDKLVPSSVLIVGPPGVGKSTWVRAVAHRLARIQGEALARKLWSTTPDRLLAGLPYLGQWQERCLAVIDELSYEGDLLHLDHLQSVVQPLHEGASIADFLDEPLEQGALTVLLEATEAELDLARRLHPSFVSRFRIVRVDEPDPAMVLELLTVHGERTAGAKLHPFAYRRLLRHLSVFARESALPGKALRFLDWLASTPQPAQPDVLTARDLSHAYARYSGVPYALLADDEPKSADAFARELAAKVVGQDHACAVVSRALARLKAGMTDPERPSASFLFVGPTGVGKTELAKQLTGAAFGSERRLVRFDMSEYMEYGSASRLLDPRSGVRSLVTALREQPLSVVLLDEIEKAHPQVLDLLLSILDEGRTTDTLGRACDLRSAMIVMTSNLGVRDRASVGFEGGSDATSLRVVRTHFRPELWNRIDYVVPFRALSLPDVTQIVRLELHSLEARDGLKRRQIRVRASARAISVLSERGFDPRFGARPLKRVIEELVVAKIAARLAAEPALARVELSVVAEGEAALGWVVMV